MNECVPEKKKLSVALLVSAAINIFLVAFVLGRMGPPMMPPPPELRGGIAEGMPHRHPPTFGPIDLFAPKELQAEESRLRPKFEEMDAMRRAFAGQLKAGQVSKEDVLKHFDSIDRIMESVKKEMQERAAEKIGRMTESERERFSRFLLEDKGRPPFVGGP